MTTGDWRSSQDQEHRSKPHGRAQQSEPEEHGPTLGVRVDVPSAVRVLSDPMGPPAQERGHHRARPARHAEHHQHNFHAPSVSSSRRGARP